MVVRGVFIVYFKTLRLILGLATQGSHDSAVFTSTVYRHSCLFQYVGCSSDLLLTNLIIGVAFFTSAIITPVTIELAVVSRGIQGVGCKSFPLRSIVLIHADNTFADAHVYGAFNIAYGIGGAGTLIPTTS